MTRRRRLPLLLVILAVAWSPAARPADDQPADDLFDLSLEELELFIVTAEKRTESLQDVPIAMTAHAGEALADFGVTDTQSLELVTPGLTYNNTGTSAQPFLRGVGTRFAFAGLEPSVSTYLDDRYIARAQATIFEFADVERIEVLKGPQGTLYGRNATGGAIRVITRGVEEEFAGNLTAGLGDYDLRYLTGTVNVPMTNALGARFSALVKQRDGYADNLVPSGVNELDDQDYLALRSKLRWDISNRVGSTLTLQYSDREDNAGNDVVDLSPPGLNVGIAGGGISGRDVDEVATAITRKIDSETYAVDLRFDVTFAHYDLVSITTHDHFDQDSATDADGTSAPLIDAFSVPQEADAYSQEFQLLSTDAGPWQWILGAYYFHEDTDFEILLDTPALISQGDQNAKTIAWAFFGQTSFEINDTWSVTVGGRWSFEEKDATVRASSVAPETTAPNPFDDSEDWEEFTPRATLEYRFDQGMAYFSYARGFKSGGYNYPASLDNGKVLSPEILDMFELGWKTELLAKRLRFNGSVFYYDYDDLQVTRAVAVPGNVVIVTENAATAEVFGIDLDLTWLVGERLTITAALNVLDSEYTEFDASANVFNAALSGNPAEPGMSTVLFDASGEDLLRAPDVSVFVSTRYVFPAGAGTVPVVLTYSYTHDYQFDFIAHPSSERLRQEGYGLLNARASYVSADQRWAASVWGNNLTNEDDYFADIVANTAGIRGSHGAPRTWGVELSYRF